MTITNTSYAAERYNAVVGVVRYDFLFESIGALAFELYAEDDIGGRRRISPDDFAVEFYDARPLFNGGRVTLTSPLLEGETVLSIERNTPITQLVDMQPWSRTRLKQIEFALDKATMICQEIAYRKCTDDEGTPQATEMSQLIPFDIYGPFRSTSLDAAIDKLTRIMLEIKAAKEDCSAFPGDA